jgi:hypothetical protein
MATSRRLLALAAAALGAQACAVVQAPVRPPVGFGYTHFSAPAETNFSATPVGAKVGRAETHYLYVPIDWFYNTGVPIELAFGDAAVARAARDAGITTIHYVDYEYTRILGLYEVVTVRVSGD